MVAGRRAPDEVVSTVPALGSVKIRQPPTSSRVVGPRMWVSLTAVTCQDSVAGTAAVHAACSNAHASARSAISSQPGPATIR